MINSTTSATRALPSSAVSQTGPATQRAQAARTDRLSTASAATLRSALANQPEIRPEVVERAKALAANPDYPSKEVLKQVGGMILNSPDLSEA